LPEAIADRALQVLRAAELSQSRLRITENSMGQIAASLPL
jgi:hypothetical protein